VRRLVAALLGQVAEKSIAALGACRHDDPLDADLLTIDLAEQLRPPLGMMQRAT
jgi:hypothetical protein